MFTSVSPTVWALTAVGFVAIVVLDLVVIARRKSAVTMRQATVWVIFYVALAALFAVGLFVFRSGTSGSEFVAGYITEYSLSVDNLFVFVVIFSRFAVPRDFQQKVLFVGILLSLVLRGGFILIGAEIIERFSWVFYIFGAFLLYTAVQLLRGGHSPEESGYQENVAIRTARRLLPMEPVYDGARLTTTVGTRRRLTPMVLVFVAIGTTDLLFALDSIPAIFGLTKEPFLVFTANAFALMGLRQLFFLIGGLLDRMVYLSTGLSVVLAFIGIKLVVEAMHHDGVSWAPQIPILVSLGVIVGTLTITAVASLIAARRGGRKPEEAVLSPGG